jgi:hypothetical protein
MAASCSAGIVGRPIGLPLLVPCSWASGDASVHASLGSNSAKTPEHPEHRPAGWRGRIDRLLVKEQIGAGAV